MMPRTRRLLIAACLCVGPGALAEAGPQAPPAARGTAVISGRILAADTGLPLRRARVTVHGTGPNIPSGPDAIRAAITDADGAFALAGLSAGRYRLEASKARYVDTAYGGRSSGLERPIEVAEGQKVENITVSLPPAGVIVGFYKGNPPGGTLLGTGQTTKTLYPAESQSILLPVPGISTDVTSGQTPIYAVVDDTLTPHPAWTECRIDNNVSAATSGACNTPK